VWVPHYINYFFLRVLCQEPSRLKQAPEASESKQLKFKVIASQGKLSSQNMDGLRDKEFSLRLS
jgi:hypothetical protein